MEDRGGKSGRRPARHLQVEASGPGNARPAHWRLAGRFRRGEVVEGCAGGAAGRSKGLTLFYICPKMCPFWNPTPLLIRGPWMAGARSSVAFVHGTSALPTTAGKTVAQSNDRLRQAVATPASTLGPRWLRRSTSADEAMAAASGRAQQSAPSAKAWDASHPRVRLGLFVCKKARC